MFFWYKQLLMKESVKNISKFYVLGNKTVFLHISNIKPEIQVHVHIYFFVVFIFYRKITLTLLLSDILIKYVLFSIYYLIKVKIVYIIFSQSFITVVNWLYIVYAHSVCKKMSSWMAEPNIYLDNDKNTYLRPDWFQFSLLLYS